MEYESRITRLQKNNIKKKKKKKKSMKKMPYSFVKSYTLTNQ